MCIRIMGNKNVEQLAQELGLKPPRKNTVVHKAECIYSTDTEKSPNGLYINLKTFESFGHDMLSYDRAASNALYLHVRKVLVPVPPNMQEDVTSDKVEDETSAVYKPKELCKDVLHYQVCSPSLKEPIPLDMLPSNVAEVCKAIIDHSGFDFKTDDFVWKEYIGESRYAKHLIQIEAPPVIKYENLSCQRCGATNNLWLNLSDGYIGCGRKNFDSGGCADGEEGAAIQHYHETGGVFPLAVKVGTITTTSGDVYSYAPDEDSVVIDPYLADHLSHFGIDVKTLQKTEKSTLQLQVEKNERHDWSDMGSTSGEVVVYGPGLVGLDNSGNTCYLNSAVQLLAAVDELASYFVTHFNSIAKNVPSDVNPHDDVLLQFAKIVKSLVTERVINQQLELVKRYQQACEEAGVEYVEPEQYKNFSVKPSMLKYAVGKMKKQFSTNEQQDAEEFLSCFINLLDEISPEIKRRCKTPLKMKDMFYFQTRQSIVCAPLNKITYNDNETHMICLPLLSAASRQVQPAEDEQILLSDCFKNWAMEQDIEYYENEKNHPAVICNSFLTLPHYLIVNLERFCFKPDCTIQKIANPIIVPAEGITLHTYAEKDSVGYKVEYNTREAKKARTDINPELLQTLMSMGFTEKLCRLACEKSGSSNVDTCVNWILSNMDTVSQDTAVGDKDASDVAVNASVLMDLGYSLEQANEAAERFGNDVAAAVDWLASNEFSSKSTSIMRATYMPVGIISHIGSSINTGHYVCHINRDNQWYTFNDSKVLKRDTMPTAHGYIYLLKKCNNVVGRQSG